MINPQRRKIEDILVESRQYKIPEYQRDFERGRDKTVNTDPVYHFFFETSSKVHKKVYNSALKKAQADQDRISKIPKINRS